MVASRRLRLLPRTLATALVSASARTMGSKPYSAPLRRELVREYIWRGLYERGTGYFARGDIIHSATAPIQFTSLWVRISLHGVGVCANPAVNWRAGFWRPVPCRGFSLVVPLPLVPVAHHVLSCMFW